MALTPRPRPKAHHRKRQAQHHHHGKLYLKAYWPYLPMLAIVGSGVLLNRALEGSSPALTSAGAIIGGSSAGVLGQSSRIQNLVGNQAAWIYLVVLGVTALAFTLFVTTHWYRLHRLMNRGERFMMKRPWLEIATVAVFTAGFILTRSASLPH